MTGRMIFSGVLGMVVLAAGLQAVPTPSYAGACFDRCMTRCHLPMGYRICRNDCFYVCDHRRR